MEGIQKAIRTATKDQKFGSSSSSESPYVTGAGLSGALSSSDQSRILVARAPRQGISLSACSKLCVVCFAVGLVVGYTLKRRVKRWASKLLKKIRDD